MKERGQVRRQGSEPHDPRSPLLFCFSDCGFLFILTFPFITSEQKKTRDRGKNVKLKTMMNRKYRGSTRHVVTSYRVKYPLCDYPSVSFTFDDSIRCSYSVGEVFFYSPIHRIRHTHILKHLRPGPSVVTGLIGSLIDLMQQNLGS